MNELFINGQGLSSYHNPVKHAFIKYKTECRKSHKQEVTHDKCK